MRYRRLGRTEWMIAEVGLAAGALAGADEALTTAALQAALDARIGVFAVEAGAPGRARAALLYSCVLPFVIGVLVMLALWAL